MPCHLILCAFVDDSNMRKYLRLPYIPFLLLVAAIAYVVPTYVLPSASASRDGATESEGCIDSDRQLIATGQGPTGRQWTVTGDVRNNDGCDSWLLGMQFLPLGIYPGSWEGAWAIPADGHLPPGFRIGARDDAHRQGRAFSGVVGERVHSIVLTMSTGEHLKIRPKLPMEQLRNRFVWLQGMRYFVSFYPSGRRVRLAELFNSSGELVGTIRGQEGAFEAVGALG
jgi:hypothetical protein